MPHVVHFDCFSGISGDMTLAALLDAGVPEAVVREAVDSTGLPGHLTLRRVVRCGLSALKVDVESPEQHAHRRPPDIRQIVQRTSMSDRGKDLALRILERLAAAEAKVHGIGVEEVTFHEVGAIDSIFDLVGVSAALAWMQPQRITASPVPTGSGWVRGSHGRMPVPAPAVAELLRGIPLRPSLIEAELTTPTGAAILAALADEFTSQPGMTIEQVGIGAGTRDHADQPNVLRVFTGSLAPQGRADEVWQVETSLDDVSPEVIGYCIERLFEAKALDVHTYSIQMKKNRPGVVLAVLCGDDVLDRVEQVLFQETGTFGMRKWRVARSKLDRQTIEIPTRFGVVRGKRGWNAAAAVVTPEYEDCARIARERGVPLRVVYGEALRRFEEEWGRDGPPGEPR